MHNYIIKLLLVRFNSLCFFYTVSCKITFDRMKWNQQQINWLFYLGGKSSCNGG